MKEASENKHVDSIKVKPTRSQDLTGQKYGEYTVSGFAGYRDNGLQYWHCVCSCGSRREIQKQNLLFSKHPSCGCVRKSQTRNLKGEKLGRFSVMAFSHKDKNNHSHWMCKCECGCIKIINGPALISGHTKSCGKCLPRD